MPAVRPPGLGGVPRLDSNYSVPWRDWGIYEIRDAFIFFAAVAIGSASYRCVLGENRYGTGNLSSNPP
jgi:hypothetical protein